MHGSDLENRPESNERIPRWSLGVLNPKDTVDVPGTVLLLVGLSSQPKPDTHSDDLNPPSPPEEPNQTSSPPRDDDPPNTTPTGILLAPQPLPHDDLSWPPWRRNLALLTIGLYSLLGGGTTPLLAAGFTNISQIFSIPLHRISLTTGLVMLGLGIGCLLASPTAILYGKRLVYLAGSLIFLLTCVWCALSPTFESLLLARFVQRGDNQSYGGAADRDDNGVVLFA